LLAMGGRIRESQRVNFRFDLYVQMGIMSGNLRHRILVFLQVYLDILLFAIYASSFLATSGAHACRTVKHGRRGSHDISE